MAVYFVLDTTKHIFAFVRQSDRIKEEIVCFVQFSHNKRLLALYIPNLQSLEPLVCPTCVSEEHEIRCDFLW